MPHDRLDQRPSVAELMLAKQEEMEAALSANRKIMPHEGEKGAAAELRWREMLSSYLPRRYSVTNGFVVDHQDGVSEQIDIIIHDAQYNPFLFQAGTSSFVPAESVYAIFDAKQEISKAMIEATGQKVASVRALKRTSGRVWTNTGDFPGKEPEKQAILGGIVAVTASWADGLGESFREALWGLPQSNALDVGVAISHGAFEVGDAAQHALVTYEKDTALVGFFIALIRKLQPLATALAMDLDIWGAPLRGKDK